MAEECGGDTEFKYALGVAASLFSSAGSATGLVVQKFAHNAQEKLPDGEKWPEMNGLIISPLWMFGFFVLVIVPLPFDLVALSMAPQSIVTALTGATIVMVQVIAPWMLSERVTRVDWLATLIIVFGCVLTTAFGSHCSEEYTLDQLLDLYDQEVFYYAEIWWFLTMTGAYILIYFVIPRRYPADTPEHHYERNKWSSICFAYIAGSYAANQNIMFKSVGELLEQSFGRGNSAAWVRAETYALMVGVLVLSTIQLMSLNRGLAMWKAVKNLPIYNVVLTVMSTTYGSIYYREVYKMSTPGLVLFGVGMVVICLGIALLALREEDPVQDEPKSATVHPELAASEGSPEGKGEALGGMQLEASKTSPALVEVVGSEGRLGGGVALDRDPPAGAILAQEGFEADRSTAKPAGNGAGNGSLVEIATGGVLGVAALAESQQPTTAQNT